MERKLMVSVLKEILDNCDELTSANVMIMPHRADDDISKGDQLHIKTPINESVRSYIEIVIKKYNLKLRTAEKDKIIIYQPATKDIKLNI